MKIVVNADDFGYSPDTVRATCDAFDQGLLTSATIMARMPSTDEALAFARSRPQFSFGVHLTFVGDGEERSLADPASIPGIVDREGRFPRTRDVRIRALLRRLPQAEIACEIAAQIARVQDAGVAVTHVDSHRHLHKFAPFRDALSIVLPQFGVRRVRNVQDVYLRRPFASPTYWLGRGWRRRLMRRFATTTHFYMPTTAGDLEWELLAERLRTLSGDSLEIGLHPGTEDTWRRHELESLPRFVKSARAGGHVLMGWDDVTAP